MAKKFIVEIPAPIRIMKDSGPVDFRQKRWESPAAAIAGIPPPLPGGANRVDADDVTIPTRVLGQRIPCLVNGRTVDYWWESDLSDAGFVPVLRDYALTVNVNNQINELATELNDQIEELREELDTDVLHKSGDETKTSGVLTFVQSPKGPEGVADNDLVNTAQILKLPNDIRFQRIQKTIPTIYKTVNGAGKTMEFLRICPTNNYAYAKITVTANGCVKVYEYLSGYDALSTSTWSRLIPRAIYRDRDYVDFEIEIKKVNGFGPLNSGIEHRFSQTLGGTTTVVMKVEFALELPWWVESTNQFVVLNNQYDWNGINGIYGPKLTMTGDGRNYYDDQGQLFLKGNSQLITDLQTYKADISYVNARLQVVEEDIEYIEETLLPLKQDKTAADSTYQELLIRLNFLQEQIDAIPDIIEFTPDMVSRLPLVDTPEQLDELLLGDPYRTSDGEIKYKVPDTNVFDDVFGYEFGGAAPSGETYAGIFSETFDLPFEL